MKLIIIIVIIIIIIQSNPIITDDLLYPWEKKALPFSLNSTRLIRTPVNTAHSVSVLTRFDYINFTVQLCNPPFHYFEQVRLLFSTNRG